MNNHLSRKDFEIMAPVGSYESLHAAINAGADAIYFGVEGLNMRAKSSVNFTLDDLREIASICDSRGVKSYLTVNTIIYDEDIDTMHKVIEAVASSGISAIIASDIAAISYARSRGVEVHISTQCNVSNREAVRFYSSVADVVVLARELNLDQVKAISDFIDRERITGPGGKPVRIEMFCHGALCMAVSGKCYLSLHEMNSSANRGACTQICRRGYTVTDRETGEQLDIENKYIMSPKDLCTIHFLNKMIDAGVRVFKIEGRARGPEYVSVAVKAYSEAIEAVYNGTYTQERIEEWTAELRKIFNRGFWNGYYLGQRLGEWSAKYGSSAERVKRYAAKGVRYFSNIGVAEFFVEAGSVSVGDEVVITGPTTGAIILKLDEIRVDLKPVETALKGESFSIKVPGKIRPSDRLYIWEPTKVSVEGRCESIRQDLG
ncbi:MAG: U32 family peptidase [Firmicutes bacterium]|nr:U32 family peptidase [Bacillota bacterium]MCM1401503.1 U32 family peptidase [Bacteroides sp.]MCM1477353.1 U32 family peptidase [Bacteroides sp.]